MLFRKNQEIILHATSNLRSKGVKTPAETSKKKIKKKDMKNAHHFIYGFFVNTENISATHLLQRYYEHELNSFKICISNVQIITTRYESATRGEGVDNALSPPRRVSCLDCGGFPPTTGVAKGAYCLGRR